MQPAALFECELHEINAWTATFDDSKTELELQPSDVYKTVMHLAEFVNVADLITI